MKIFLAGTCSNREATEACNPKYVLESFYYFDDWQVSLLKNTEMFLLDSGAFTFLMKKQKEKIDFEKYVEQYAEFINKYNIKYFFELDIDSVIGYENVLKLRRKLEKLTNKKCIPVWHYSRGADAWKELCENYDYIAIGGIISKEIKKKQYPMMKKLIAYAHSRGVKVHGLGFTSIGLLDEYHFDSVDSTNWSFGRFGHHWVYKDGHIKMMHRPEGKKCIDRKGLAEFNMRNWIQFQKYAERNL